jgi:hypothetical protein
MFLSQYRAFWRTRTFGQRLRFRIFRRLFLVKYFAQTESSNAQILLNIVGIATLQLLTAIGIAVGVQIIELLLVPKLIAFWPIPDAQIYANWLGTIAQIGGVFIALYFTAVTAAAGAIYSQVPNNVRNLLARDRVGNTYIRYLIFATFVPLCFVALNLVGLAPLRLAIPIIAITTGVGIIAFAKLGKRAFDLFDPTNLSQPLLQDLHKVVKQVSAGGFQWMDPAFQNYAYRQAAEILDTADTLSDLSANHSNLDGRPLLDLTKEILFFLAWYQWAKLGIPTTSQWFEQEYEHKDWYLSQDTFVEFAHKAGITLSPDIIRESYWVEDRLESVLLRCFEVNVRRRRLANLMELFDVFGRYAAALAGSGNVRRAMDLNKALCDTLKAAGGQPADDLQLIAIAERIAGIQIQILIGYCTSENVKNPDVTRRKLKKTRWHRRISIYTNGWLDNELRQLEWLFPRILFEMNIEGKLITPIWYSHALITKAQVESLGENVDALLDACDSTFGQQANRFTKDVQMWASAAILSRCIEYVNKLETRYISWMKMQFSSLQGARYLKGLDWPDVNPESWSARMNKAKEQLSKSLAAHIGLLLGSKRPEKIYDYLGQFIHTVGENLFDALINQRGETVQALIGSYFAGSFGLFDKLKPAESKPDYWTLQRLQVAAAPMLDLMELSGYAKLMADFHKKSDLWTLIQTKWDNLLDAQPEVLKWLYALVTAGKPRFQLPPRGLIRTNWAIRVNSELSKLPLRSIAVGRSSNRGIIMDESVLHDSPLVRYCARRNFFDGIDIFVGIYLARRTGADAFEWERDDDRLDDHLDREEQRYHQNDTNETASD